MGIGVPSDSADERKLPLVWPLDLVEAVHEPGVTKRHAKAKTVDESDRGSRWGVVLDSSADPVADEPSLKESGSDDVSCVAGV